MIDMMIYRFQTLRISSSPSLVRELVPTFLNEVAIYVVALQELPDTKIK